jgi:acyl-CoA thioesterase-1
MKENLDRIISRAKERRIAVILTGMEAPPNYGPVYTSEFREVLGTWPTSMTWPSCHSFSKALRVFRN